MNKPEDKKRTFNYLNVVMLFIALTAGSFFISTQLFWFLVGFTAILAFIYLIMVWDDITIWWSTRGKK